MDKHSKGTELIRSLPFTAVLLAAACGITSASAFFTAEAGYEPVRIRVGSIGFENGGQVITADIKDAGTRVTPYRDGDCVETEFSYIYEGISDCYAVPCLELRADNHTSADTVVLSDGIDSVTMENGYCRLYSRPVPLKNGEELRASYSALIVHTEGEIPLCFSSCRFSVAVIQAANNESAAAAYSAEELYLCAEEKCSTGAGSGTPERTVAGFAYIIEPDKTVCADTGEKLEDHRQFAVRLTADNSANSGNVIMKWYAQAGGEAAALSAGDDGSVWLLFSDRLSGMQVYYTLRNEAGTVKSPITQLAVEEKRVIAENYGGD